MFTHPITNPSIHHALAQCLGGLVTPMFAPLLESIQQNTGPNAIITHTLGAALGDILLKDRTLAPLVARLYGDQTPPQCPQFLHQT